MKKLVYLILFLFFSCESSDNKYPIIEEGDNLFIVNIKFHKCIYNYNSYHYYEYVVGNTESDTLLIIKSKLFKGNIPHFSDQKYSIGDKIKIVK